MKSFRIVVLSVVVLIFFVFLSFSYSQNKIAVVEGEQIKLFEYNALEEKYEQIWESIDIREKKNRRWNFAEPIIMDFDNDGKNELIAMDEFGLFVWGKHGIYPEYYNFEEAYLPGSFYQLIIADIDNDSLDEIITQGRYNGENRTITIWKVDGT